MNQESGMRRIAIALVDDHWLFRDGLARLITSEADMEIVGQYGNFGEALQSIATSAVDIVLLELTVRGEPSDTFMSAARRLGYPGRFLFVTGAVDAAQSAAVLKLGASGIVLKSESSHRLLHAVRLVASGEACVNAEVIQLLAKRYPQHEDRSIMSLSEREQVVLKGILDGMSNRRIGSVLGVSESSVKGTVQQLFEKASVRTRCQLVRAALAGALGNYSSRD